MKKYLITGGAGFIGSQLTNTLLKENNQIICLDDFNNFYDPQIKQANIENFKKNKNFYLETGDIRDKNFLTNVFEKHKFDQVIHLAARAGVRPSLSQPLLYEEVNIQGTLNILECLKKYNIKKMIFASSSSVYGTNKKVPFKETDLLQKVISPYAVTKLSCEMFCHSYSHLYNINIICLRFFTVYGPSQRPEMAIHKFTDAIFNNKEIIMYGDGSAMRDYTFVEDIIQGITASIQADFNFEIINLGNSYAITLKELISHIEKISGKKANIKQLDMQPGDVPQTFASIEKAKQLLNYNPQTNIHEGIEKFIAWYKIKTGL